MNDAKLFQECTGAIEVAGRSVEIAYRREDPYVTHFVKSGYFAEHVCNVILQEVDTTKSPVILDIGANIGLVSLFLAHSRPDASIFAFEPSPETYGYLRRNISSSPNIRALPIAVGANPSTVTFFSNSRSAAGSFCVESTAINRPMPAAENTATVPCLPLDDLVHILRLPDIAAIKLDVEGFEASVLRGSSHTLTSMRATWVLEFNPWAISHFCQTSPKDFLFYVFSLFQSVESLTRRTQGVTEPLTEHVLNDYLASFAPGEVDDLICKNAQ
jgi:FkbM family methyltransferase